MDPRIPPRKVKILLESNPPKSRILVGRLAVNRCRMHSRVERGLPRGCTRASGRRRVRASIRERNTPFAQALALQSFSPAAETALQTLIWRPESQRSNVYSLLPSGHGPWGIGSLAAGRCRGPDGLRVEAEGDRGVQQQADLRHTAIHARSDRQAIHVR